MQAPLVVQLTVLVGLSNGVPVVAARLCGTRFSCPVDGGRRWLDGRPVFGASKTLRGIVLSVIVTAAAATVLGFPWPVGALVAALAMVGDLCSSFIKRRLGLPPGSRATGLDQVAESLFPLLGLRCALALTAADIAAGVAGFFVAELLLSRLLYRWHIRRHPY